MPPLRADDVRERAHVAVVLQHPGVDRLAPQLVLEGLLDRRLRRCRSEGAGFSAAPASPGRGPSARPSIARGRWQPERARAGRRAPPPATSSSGWSSRNASWLPREQVAGHEALGDLHAQLTARQKDVNESRQCGRAPSTRPSKALDHLVEAVHPRARSPPVRSRAKWCARSRLESGLARAAPGTPLALTTGSGRRGRGISEGDRAMKRLMIGAAALGVAMVMAERGRRADPGRPLRRPPWDRASWTRTATASATTAPGPRGARARRCARARAGPARETARATRASAPGTAPATVGRRRQLQRDRARRARAGGASSRTRRPAARTASVARAALRNRRSIMAVPCRPGRRAPFARPVPRADRPPGARLDGGARGVRHGAAGEPRAAVGVAPVPPPPRPRALHRRLRARRRARVPADLRAVDPRRAGCSGWPRAAAALVGFTGGGLLGYQVARRVSKDRVEELIEGNPKARAIRDALRRRGPWRTLLVVTLLRLPPNSPFAPHQPRDGHDRRAAPGLRRRHVPRHAAAHGGGRRARRGRLGDAGRRTSRPSCATGGRGSSRPASWGGWPCSGSSERSPAAPSRRVTA